MRSSAKHALAILIVAMLIDGFILGVIAYGYKPEGVMLLFGVIGVNGVAVYFSWYLASLIDIHIPER